jgi:membrane protein DedA with SNARE-associated domain
MSLAAIMITAWSAAALGDNLGYWIGRAGGRRLLLKAGVNRHRMMRFERFFRRFGIWLVLFGRFFDGTRQLDGLVAGSARMPWTRFLFADLSGCAIWVSFWSVGLYTLDRHHTLVHRLLLQIDPWFAIPVLALLAGLLFYLYPRGGPTGGTSIHREMASDPADSIGGGRGADAMHTVRRQS